MYVYVYIYLDIICNTGKLARYVSTFGFLFDIIMGGKVGIC